MRFRNILLGGVCAFTAALFIGNYTYTAMKNEASSLRSNNLELACRVQDLEKALRASEVEREALVQQISYVQGKSQHLATLVGNLTGDRRVGMKKKDFRMLVASTLDYLGEHNISDWMKLIELTMACESDYGFYLSGDHGSAHGILQIQRATERDVLDWLRAYYPTHYQRIKDLRVPAKLSVHELRYNNAYSIGLTYYLYKRRNVDPKDMGVKELAAAYKKAFNTPKGAATIKGILKKAEEHGLKLGAS